MPMTSSTTSCEVINSWARSWVSRIQTSVGNSTPSEFLRAMHVWLGTLDSTPCSSPESTPRKKSSFRKPSKRCKFGDQTSPTLGQRKTYSLLWWLRKVATTAGPKALPSTRTTTTILTLKLWIIRTIMEKRRWIIWRKWSTRCSTPRSLTTSSSPTVAISPLPKPKSTTSSWTPSSSTGTRRTRTSICSTPRQTDTWSQLRKPTKTTRTITSSYLRISRKVS